MNVRVVRFVVGLAATAMVSVLGAGMANASTADQIESRIEAAATAQTTHTAGEYLQQLRDYLAAAVASDDVAAVQAAVAGLRPVLGAVAETPVERSALVLTDQVDAKAAQVERDLPGLGLLAPISGLVTSLLTTLLDLVTSLLGGLPVPLPVPLPELPVPLPELPGVPLPEVPGVPEVPTPEVPDVPAPGEPPVDAPLPELPLPDAPLPDAPLPDAPVPDAPLPALP